MNINKLTPLEESQQVSLRMPPVYTPDMTTVVGRLKHLRHVVEQIDPARLDMRVVMHQTARGDVGCIMGWAAMDPVFNAYGLALRDAGHRGPSYVGEYEVIFCGRRAPGRQRTSARALGISGKDLDYIATDHDAWSDPDGAQARGLARIDRMISKYSGES